MDSPHIVIVSNKPLSKIATLKTLNKPSGSSLQISRAFGFGKARNEGAKLCGLTGLMVQLNDDLVLSPKFWAWIESLRCGEFAMMVVGGQSCSRIFAVHLQDYWALGGCDESQQFFFEDGEFYNRAIHFGLKFKTVPNELVQHIPHRHAFYKPRLNVEAECCRTYAKYGRLVQANPIKFFIPFHDYRILFQHLVMRVTLLNYYIVRSFLKWKK